MSAQHLLPAYPIERWGVPMPNLHIMVIEDDAATLEYVYDLLTMHSYNASRWISSSQALEQVTRRQPHLIVLDYRMGKHAVGWLIMLSLHALPETAHIPVILYSGQHIGLQTHRDEIWSMGGDILEKPFQVKELLAKIEALTTAIKQ
jgi:DNA-binding response OmpR family regulator